MDFRTDLALERKEMVNEDIDGVDVSNFENDECKTTVIEIKTDKAAKRLGKGVGKYITLEMNNFSLSKLPPDSKNYSYKKGIGENPMP